MNDVRVLTMREFLRRYSVSKTTLYQLWGRNRTRMILVSERVMIPVDAAENGSGKYSIAHGHGPRQHLEIGLIPPYEARDTII